MGTSSGLDSEDAILGESFIFDQEFLIFTGEDVVGHSSYNEWSDLVSEQKGSSRSTYVVLASQLLAECKSQCCLSRAHGAANPSAVRNENCSQIIYPPIPIVNPLSSKSRKE